MLLYDLNRYAIITQPLRLKKRVATRNDSVALWACHVFGVYCCFCLCVIGSYELRLFVVVIVYVCVAVCMCVVRCVIMCSVQHLCVH